MIQHVKDSSIFKRSLHSNAAAAAAAAAACFHLFWLSIRSVVLGHDVMQQIQQDIVQGTVFFMALI
jgi:hypothetical protein